MEQQPPTMPQLQPHTHKKILKRILIGLGIVLISAAITVALITLFHKSSVTTPVKALTSAELIKKYTDEHKLANYEKSSTMSDSIISYKLSDTAYTVQISSRDNIQFARTENSTTQDIALTVDSGKTFLTSNGFKVVPDQISTDQTQLLYDSQDTVCKLHNSFDPNKKASSYGLVCTDKKALVAERDAIKALADLYTQAGNKVDFKNVVRINQTEGNKSLAMLSVSSQDTAKAPYTLVFAAIDAKWAYLGSRPTPSVDVADSFAIPSSLKTAVNDPKYGGFVAKYIH